MAEAGPIVRQLDKLPPIGSRAGVRSTLGSSSTHNTLQFLQRTDLDSTPMFSPDPEIALIAKQKSVIFVQIVPNMFDEKLQGQII